MPLRTEEIDSAIQGALKQRLAQIFSPAGAQDPTAARVRSEGLRAWRETARRHLRYFVAGGGSFAASWLAAPALAVVSGPAAALGFFGLMGLGVGLVIRGFQRTNRELSRFASADLLRGAAVLVALSRAEQLYCEAVAALVDAGAVLNEAVQREILQQLNALLESHRKLEGPVRQLRAASVGGAVEALEQEVAELAQRRDTHEDEAARRTMEQSIALCTERLNHARAMEPAREKAEAQQELILQSMASVQARLARIGTAGLPAPEADAEAVRESVTQVCQQTRAVEEAVAEVVALRGS